MPSIAVPPKPTPIERAKRWLSYEIPKREPRSLAFAFAIAAKGYGLTEDEVRAELMLTGRFNEGSTTIERAISNAWGNTTGEYSKGAAWPSPNIQEVERVVAESRITVETLRQGRRNRVSDYSQAQIIESLFYPKAPVCVGLCKDGAMTLPLETILGKRSDLLTKWQFLCANPMRARTGKVKRPDGTTYDSARSKDNACKEENRRFVVVECDYKKERDGKATIWKPTIEKWEAEGITVKDAAVRVLAALLSSRHQRVALVVDSAGASLHCWINARTFEPGKLKEFQDDACKLGADPASYRLSQFVRFPGRARDNGKRQEILFYDPTALPQTETP